MTPTARAVSHTEKRPDGSELMTLTGVSIHDMVLSMVNPTPEQQEWILRLAACWNVCLSMETCELIDMLATMPLSGRLPRKIIYKPTIEE